MGILKKYKFIVITVVAFVLLSFIYANYFAGSEEDPLLRSEGGAGSVSVDEELLALLLSVQSIKLDDSVFNSPAFQSLNDFSRSLILEPVGRVNPFASFDRGAARNPR